MSRRTRRIAVPLLLAAFAAGTAAPASAGVGPGPGQGGRATPEIVETTKLQGQVAALTFDDGPNPVDTPRLLEVLAQNDVRAVFCLWGDFVERHPDVVRQIAAAGHTLCNHTLHHDNLAGWSPDQAFTAEEVRADLEATSALIREAVPGARIPYFRAPYGAWGEHSAQVAADLGMQPLGWRVDIADWETQDPDVLAQRLEDRIRANPGGVVLLHDGPVVYDGDGTPTSFRAGTVEAVARVVPELKAEGWRFHQPDRRG
jgi:peptidoglycan-N-acetylglucosamine deacetylase